MLFIYNIGVRIYYFLILFYQYFNPKARLWISGRKKLFAHISNEVDINSASIWFHFASLGEFEQGRPVIEQAKKAFPGYKIIITFFSPSGYELRKNYKHADHIFYLPLDTKNNAEKFVKLINPSVAIFTKYEFWYHFFYETQRRKVPLIVISAIFRESQPFFKWYGQLNRKILSFVDHFFVQDEKSRQLLASISLKNVTINGDTRFDRVTENASHNQTITPVEKFVGQSKTFIAGSTWPEDEKLIVELIKKYDDWKFIIAPHEIRTEKINNFHSMISSSIKYSDISDMSNEEVVKSTSQVLIIDNIGMLSSLYRYAHISYIGGGFGTGIHNTLEAAAFGLPVIFGPNYEKFLEARALIERGAGFSINNLNTLFKVMEKLQNEKTRMNAGNIAANYVQQQCGATQTIMHYLDKILGQAN